MFFSSSTFTLAGFLLFLYLTQDYRREVWNQMRRGAGGAGSKMPGMPPGSVTGSGPPAWDMFLYGNVLLGGCIDEPRVAPMTDLEWQITANETCHSPRTTSGDRVVNGQPAGIGSRAFQVALFRRNRFACGGSFISGRFVLTAAHCVQGYKPDELKVRYASRYYDFGPTIWVHSIHRHPGYDPAQVRNDLALLRLAFPLPRLPMLIEHVELSTEPVLANQTVVVSGWGRTGRSLPVSKRLLVAPLKVVEPRLCQQQWNHTFSVDPDSMICAADEDRSACHGDSGGPLTWDEKLVGIVSVGSASCLSKHRPNIYTNVSHYIEWIHNTIESNP